MLSKEEQIKMYMKLSKQELCEMLYDLNVVLLSNKEQYNVLNESANEINDDAKCNTWADCMNPYMDCVNCPLKKKI